MVQLTVIATTVTPVSVKIRVLLEDAFSPANDVMLTLQFWNIEHDAWMFYDAECYTNSLGLCALMLMPTELAGMTQLPAHTRSRYHLRVFKGQSIHAAPIPRTQTLIGFEGGCADRYDSTGGSCTRVSPSSPDSRCCDIENRLCAPRFVVVSRS